MEGSVRNQKQPAIVDNLKKLNIVDNHGHSFTKKTFNCPRPVYCHHCLDLLNCSFFNIALNCEGISRNTLGITVMGYCSSCST